MIIKRKNKRGKDKEAIVETIVAPDEIIEEKTPEDSEEKSIFTNIDINQIAERKERRRGDRRKGYRRIDDRNIVSRAQEEANQIKENAAKEGLSKGLETAQEEINSLKKAIEDMIDIKKSAMVEVQNEITEISIKIAEKIIKKEVELDEEIILNILADAIKEIDRDEKLIIINVNPQNENIIKTNLPEIFSTSTSKAQIEVETDESIDMAGCIINTKSGIIDAQIKTQLDILQKLFQEQL